MVVAYADLTTEQKAAVQEFVQPLRSCIGNLVKVLNNTAALKAKWTGNVDGIVALLASGDLIPDESTIEDSEPLTAAGVSSLIGYLLAMADQSTGIGTDYHRALYVKAAGVLNQIG
jgi:hypothetical protein